MVSLGGMGCKALLAPLALKLLELSTQGGGRAPVLQQQGYSTLASPEGPIKTYKVIQQVDHALEPRI